MDYLKKFKKHSEYEAIKNSLLNPNVSYCANQADVHYKVKDYRDEYLTFEALESGTFSLDIGSAVSTSVLSSISYSIDSGETWVTTNNVNSQPVTITTPTVTAGNTVMWKGSGTGVSTTINNNDRPSTSSIFSSTGTFNAKGNILSLIYGDDFAEEDSVTGTYNFALLFYCNNMAKTAKLVSCKNMAFPIKNVPDFCYFRMFQSCTLVTPMRIIDAESMGNSACMSMFINCPELTEAPELPAKTLSSLVYRSLFSGCPKLKKAPELPCTSVPSSGYMQTFYNCISLTDAPDLPSLSAPSACYGEMFKGCTNLTVAPKLPATTLGASAYTSMFSGCISLTVAPDLPAAIVPESCYDNMFRNCTSLVIPSKMLATTIGRYSCRSMYHTCPKLSVPPSLPATTLSFGSYAYMFNYCTSLTVGPELPSTTLAEGCYGYMFYGCSNLKTAPKLSATELLYEAPYQNMFQNCTSLVTAPDLPATTLSKGCYYYMFAGCTSLRNIPDLPVATVPINGYQAMFSGCTSLNKITCLATDISASGATTNWVNGVAASGTFVKAPSMTSWSRGASGIPNGWNIENEGDGVVSMITFTIYHSSENTQQYQAEEGMTWHEWINSGYNTDGWQEQTYSNVTYIWKSGESIQGNNSHDETPSDVILDGHTYTTVINDPGLVIG